MIHIKAFSFEYEIVFWGNGKFSGVKTLKSSHEIAAVCRLWQPAPSATEGLASAVSLSTVSWQPREAEYTWFGSWKCHPQ